MGDIQLFGESPAESRWLAFDRLDEEAALRFAVSVWVCNG